MKIIVEKNIPYIQGLLEPFGTVDYLPANEITADTVKDADALFVRTRTKCNAALLDGSRVKFIATATIGTDHIDLPYCREKGITVRNAPGCNAPAVAQYVFATIARWMEGKPMSPRELTLGVVGVGNVGKSSYAGHIIWGSTYWNATRPVSVPKAATSCRLTKLPARPTSSPSTLR